MGKQGPSFSNSPDSVKVIFMKREIPCPPGHWTRIIANRFIAMPKLFMVEFIPVNGSTVSGRYRETYTNWIFPGSMVSGALASSMEFQRKWINTFYYIEVKPDTQLTAVVR